MRDNLCQASFQMIVFKQQTLDVLSLSVGSTVVLDSLFVRIFVEDQ